MHTCNTTGTQGIWQLLLQSVRQLFVQSLLESDLPLFAQSPAQLMLQGLHLRHGCNVTYKHLRWYVSHPHTTCFNTGILRAKLEKLFSSDAFKVVMDGAVMVSALISLIAAHWLPATGSPEQVGRGSEVTRVHVLGGRRCFGGSR